MRTQNDAIIDRLMNDVDNVVKSTVAQVTTKSAGITSVTPQQAIDEVSESLSTLFTKAVNNITTLSVTGSLNLGRTSVYERSPEKVYAMQYSAILDGRTTMTCLSLDGRVVRA